MSCVLRALPCVAAALFAAPAAAQTDTSSGASALPSAPAAAQTDTSSGASALPPAPAPAPAPVQNLATPVGIPVAPSTPWTDKLRYQFVVLSTARWQQDNGDRTTFMDSDWNPTGENFGDLITTFGGSVGYESFQLAARFDTAFYFHRPVAHPEASPLIKLQLEDRYVNIVRPEYVALSYNKSNLSFVLGDFYMTLGRGMILSIRKVGDIGVDNKLRGAKARVRFKVGPGEFTVTQFGGWVNIKNYEAGTGFYYPERSTDARGVDGRFWDASDFVAGGRLAYRIGKYLKVGAHAARIASPEDEVGQSAVVTGYGANVELPRPVKWFSLYAEIARLTRDDTRLEFQDETRPGDSLRDLDEEGWGVYTNASLYLGDATVLIEGKYYDNMFNVFPRGIRQPKRQVLNRLIEPPTAERPLTLLLANNTVYGGRVRVDYRVAPGWVPFVGLGLYRDNSFGRAPDGTAIAETPPANIFAGYGGARIAAKWAEFTVEGGYRTQRNDFPAPAEDANPQQAQQARDLDGSVFRDDAHIILDWHQPLFGQFSAEFAVNFLHARQQNSVNCTFLPAEGADEAEQRLVDACAGRGADVVFVSVPDTWNEGRVALSLISSNGWAVTGAWEFYTLQPEIYDQNYFSIAGQWEFMDGGIVRALYGGERAGLKCSGGVCRFFPGFEGGRLELNMRL